MLLPGRASLPGYHIGAPIIGSLSSPPLCNPLILSSSTISTSVCFHIFSVCPSSLSPETFGFPSWVHVVPVCAPLSLGSVLVDFSIQVIISAAPMLKMYGSSPAPSRGPLRGSSLFLHTCWSSWLFFSPHVVVWGQSAVLFPQFFRAVAWQEMEQRVVRCGGSGSWAALPTSLCGRQGRKPARHLTSFLVLFLHDLQKPAGLHLECPQGIAMKLLVT